MFIGDINHDISIVFMGIITYLENWGGTTFFLGQPLVTPVTHSDSAYE